MAVIPWHSYASWVSTFSGIHIPIPTTLAVQPIVTLRAACIFTTGILCAIWFLGQTYPPDALKKILRSVLIFLAVLTGVAAVALLAGFKNPAFPQTEIFSYFANRNQSASLYAITGIIAGGLLAFEKRLLWRAICVVCLAIALLSLALGPSRGGWLTLGVGGAILLLSSRRGIALAAVLAVAFAGLVLWGIPGLESRSAGEGEVRPTFFINTMHMIGESPWGVGAGNFEYVFPQYQTTSMGDRVVIHPESDAWWVIGELGLPAFLLPIAFLTLSWGRHRRIKIVLAIFAGMILISFFDVPFHRLGIITLLCAILGPSLKEPPKPLSHKAPLLLFLLPIGLIVASQHLADLLDKTREQFVHSLARENLSYTRYLGQKLTKYTPLDFRHYQELGAAELSWSGSKNAATDFFQKAQNLQPMLPLTPYQIGFAWQPIDKNKAVSAWREALRRCNGKQKQEFFFHILSTGSLESADYAALCGRDPELWAMLLQHTDPKNFPALVSRMSAQGCDFWSLPKAAILAHNWLETDNSPQTVAFFQKDPHTPTHILALTYAQQHDYRRAVKLGLSAFKSLPLKDIFPNDSDRDLTLKIRIMPDQAAEYLEALASRAQKNNKSEDLMNILAALSKTHSPPPAGTFLYAQLLADKNMWFDSWQQLNQILFLNL